MTTETLDDTWFSRDRPVLLAIGRAPHRWDGLSSGHVIAAGANFPEDDVERAISALGEAGYVEALATGRVSGRVTHVVAGITERGRRELGLWPSQKSVVDAVIAAIEDAIKTAGPERRSFLERARDGLSALPQDAALAVGSALLGGLVTR